VLKDFGSVLSMHPETKAETLAALREVYDGAWARHLGTDGGRMADHSYLDHAGYRQSRWRFIDPRSRELRAAWVLFLTRVADLH
jgi:hypothetical protein